MATTQTKATVNTTILDGGATGSSATVTLKANHTHTETIDGAGTQGSPNNFVTSVADSGPLPGDPNQNWTGAGSVTWNVSGATQEKLTLKVEFVPPTDTLHVGASASVKIATSEANFFASFGEGADSLYAGHLVVTTPDTPATATQIDPGSLIFQGPINVGSWQTFNFTRPASQEGIEEVSYYSGFHTATDGAGVDTTSTESFHWSLLITPS